jgi:hypothetical protein
MSRMPRCLIDFRNSGSIFVDFLEPTSLLMQWDLAEVLQFFPGHRGNNETQHLFKCTVEAWLSHRVAEGTLWFDHGPRCWRYLL